MRPLRFLLSLATCVAAFLVLVYARPWQSSQDYVQQDLNENTGLRAFFNWRTPSSLFPPSAIISLTDDNSTFFLARPAAFGPGLPVRSLSGQLWIGSGFGGDHLGRGWMADSQGELGCSDIPEWIGGTRWPSFFVGKKTTGDRRAGTDADGMGIRKRSTPVEAIDEHIEREDDHPKEEDGTDDHLHHPLSASGGLKSNGQPVGVSRKSGHADIQSIQEGAEIAGKIVLLSRGGCGFLEKVKWVQRRGGVALIVGDDIRGGPLVTMYARGDTSNITIPALFTSHTTAHLLTTLIPAGGELDEMSLEDDVQLDEALQLHAEGRKSVDDQDDNADRQSSTAASVASESRLDLNHRLPSKLPKAESLPEHKASDATSTRARNGWLHRMFRGQTVEQRKHRIRPTAHDDRVERNRKNHPNGKSRFATKKGLAAKPQADFEKPVADRTWDDGFVIGVQDWRDPDFLAKTPSEAVSSSDAARQTTDIQQAGPKGGSIIPGSGEYAKSARKAIDVVGSSSFRLRTHISQQNADHNSDRRTKTWYIWSSQQGGDRHKDINTFAPKTQPGNSRIRTGASPASSSHEGLWVTLSPTSMSSSPFFDTLLVLVVSPLITLTVVYALLLLRSRIRRRRWRAPKSVVERLPVRTYQTLSSASSTSSARTDSAIPSDTTPLLPSSARPISTASRPRSRTTSEVPAPSRSSVPSMASPSLRQTEEKRSAGLAEWRRRYGGKQRECVVCLEEYVHGVSRVMSLPCGHEFHAECITPWLTTRRRTCPICKGDVVRSLARYANVSSSSSARDEYQGVSEDEAAEDLPEDVQEQAATTSNDDPASAQPLSRDDEAFEDLERGVDRTR
nr:putative e3 ubiquitin-protein ligase plr-1 [Quercus suber]